MYLSTTMYKQIEIVFKYCAAYQEGMDILIFNETGMTGL